MYSDAGADGLGTFFPLIFALIIILASIVGIAGYFISHWVPAGLKPYILFGAAVAPFLGVLCFFGIITYLNHDTAKQNDEYIKEWKSRSETVTYHSSHLGIEFTYLTPDINGDSTKLVETDGQIILEQGMNIINHVRIINVPADSNLKKIVTEKFLAKEDECFVKEVPDVFLNIPNISGNVVGIDNFNCNGTSSVSNSVTRKVNEEVFSKEWNTSSVIYFVRYPQNPSQVLVIGLSDRIYNIPATKEALSTNHYKNKNLWYQGIKFVK